MTQHQHTTYQSDTISIQTLHLN